ncbi:metallophosphoesterase [Paracoccus sp. DMF-8]|uniref:metallophosphoesterase n=1 Tax=Paracoccus sp. DMF-8 TaxID=3019445 RepID=UPI0023E42334|nr:metallophosphoesterase [Paracoccus sp. DMF-8]MDF3607310.1 metallophosphoesterase [Paracoccus sp. DMF-8]
MFSRRDILASVPAAALATAATGALAQGAAETTTPQGFTPFRFGVISDPQFAPTVPNATGTRFYANSLWKLDEAITELNSHDDLEFVVTLGDVIDRHWDSYSYIMPVYDRLKHPRHFLLGNHDYDYPGEWFPSVLRTVGLPAPYYDFAVKGVRFIALDGNEISTFALPPDDPRHAIAQERLAKLQEAGAENAQSWNGSLSDEQFAWLESRLTAAEQAGERTILLCHYPIYPANEHNLWDSERIVELIGKHPTCMAWFNGHNHAGNYGAIGKQHFVNFRGMVDTPDTSCFAIVSVHEDRIEIQGFGREESRTLEV